MCFQERDNVRESIPQPPRPPDLNSFGNA